MSGQSSEFLDKLIELLEQIDTPMIEVDASVEQLQALQYYGACLDEWGRIGLKSKGASPLDPADYPRPR